MQQVAAALSSGRSHWTAAGIGSDVTAPIHRLMQRMDISSGVCGLVPEAPYWPALMAPAGCSVVSGRLNALLPLVVGGGA
jgi:hypothetical protein